MKAKTKITYVAPPYESVQHEVTKKSEDGRPLHTSFHTDISLLQRIDRIRLDSSTLEQLKQELQPLVSADLSPQLEEAFDGLSDFQKLDTLDDMSSRWQQTQSSIKERLTKLAEKDKEIRANAAKAAEEQSEKDRLESESKEFTRKLQELFSE